jgi:hypothetical protein
VVRAHTAALLAAQALPGAASAQERPRAPVLQIESDAAGVEWTYEERADEIDDRWQVLAFGSVWWRLPPPVALLWASFAWKGWAGSCGSTCQDGRSRKVRG